MYQYHDSIALPFTSTTWNSIGTIASHLVSTFPVSQSDWANQNYKSWEDKSYQIGTHNAWDGITENKAVPQAYLDKYTPLI